MGGTMISRHLFLLACVAGFVVLKLYALHFAAGDENIYFYLASAMADGELPYRDFFHAHPPLHLLPLAWIYRAADGFALWPPRLLAGLSIVASAFLIARIARQPFAWAAVIGSGIFLYSFDVLRISTHFVGSNLGAFWVALGLERLCRRREGQAAAAFCLGSFTMLNVAPAAVGAALVLVFVDRQRGLRLALYGALGTALLNGLAIAVFGLPYLEQVFFFHLAKSEAGRQSAGVFAAIVQMNGWLIAGAALGAIGWLLGVVPRDNDCGPEEPGGRPGGGIREELEAQLPLALSLGAALGSLCLLALANRIFVYYFQVLFVCLAPLAGAGFVALGSALRGSFGTGLDAAPSVGESRFAASVLATVLIAGQLPGWTTKSGDLSPGLVQYLRHEADAFTSADPLAVEVRKHCGSGTTVFGDSTAVPLVALLADRKLALGEGDTNHLRFGSGQTSTGAFIEALEAAPPCAVVYREDHGLFVLPAFSSWLDDHYAPVFRARDAHETRLYDLLIRIDRP